MPEYRVFGLYYRVLNSFKSSFCRWGLSFFLFRQFQLLENGISFSHSSLRSEMSFFGTDFVMNCNLLAQKGPNTSQKWIERLSVLLPKIQFWEKIKFLDFWANSVFAQMLQYSVLITTGNNYHANWLLWELITGGTYYHGK